MKRRHIITGMAAIALVAGAAWATLQQGFVFNTTISAPTGLWRVTATNTDSIERGALVSVCPPALKIVETMRKRGYLHVGRCAGINTVPLLKPVAAIEGDTVTVQPGKAVLVNGKLLANTEPRPGIPGYPAGEYRVQPGQVWLLSSYDTRSFDSRYFGPASTADIQGEARPVFIKGNVAAMTGGVP